MSVFSSRFIIDTIVLIAMAGVVFFLYQTYGPKLAEEFFGEPRIVISFNDVPVSVFVADTDETRQKGLSELESLPEDQGMIFVFEQEGQYGFWMKDTLIPLDIIWIDDNLTVVHIERNVRPESYPTIYHSPTPARFVVEVNAFFTSTFKINKGDTVTIPAERLPPDLK